MTQHETVPAEVRQARIRSYVNEHEFVRVSDISERFDISEVTARADLTALAEQGYVRRVHGGAVPRKLHRLERPFDLTEAGLVAARAHLGNEAATRVRSGDAILVDVGTTTTALARALVARLDLVEVSVFTNGLTIALELEAAFPRITVVVTGGTLRPMQHSLVNPLGEHILDGINATTAFIGCNGVDSVGGITNINLPEAEIKQKMVAAARSRIVMAEGRKVGVVELARVCSFDSVDELITDDRADDDEVAKIRDRGVEVTVVPHVEGVDG
ncbi:MAG TPA: DeoR/GlpR family DNA-binding transcription regulator [Ilumatobacter sp.]|nr:DeoR/GlpR family DNA-binding transcription regulator [Ilumatobacter sp.]